jgi:hypothetical protein
MVVVDAARKMINKTIDITVTSVHQTTAGKMIFGKYDERAAVPAGETAGARSGESSSGQDRPPRSYFPESGRP